MAEFSDYANSVRQTMHTRPSFGLPTSEGPVRFTLYTIVGDYQGAVLAAPGESAATYQHGPIAVEGFQQYASNWGLPKPAIRQASGDARTIDIFQASRLVASEPENLIFYTGAGISNTGDNPVYDHRTLGRKLGFVDGSFAAEHDDPEEINDRFVRSFRTSEAFRGEIAEQYGEFLENMFNESTTPAHMAISSLVGFYDFGPTVLTSNYDCKHEATPSNIQAMKVPAGWHHRPDEAGIAAYDAITRATAQRLGSGLLIVAGAMRDTRGVFEHITQANPGIKVLAINDRPAEELDYVGVGDYCVTGDAQEILPEIARLSI
jgi:NAD-dependent SIR2 family protein deacetylase